MFSLIYSSEAIEPFNFKRLSDLCNKSAGCNQQLDITGYLYYRDGKFIQYLEGEELKVSGLMSRILKDSRHNVTQVIQEEGRTQRRFPNWSMHYLHKGLVHFEDVIGCHLELLKYSKTSSNTDQIWRVLDRLAESRNHNTLN